MKILSPGVLLHRIGRRVRVDGWLQYKCPTADCAQFWGYKLTSLNWTNTHRGEGKGAPLTADSTQGEKKNRLFSPAV